MLRSVVVPLLATWLLFVGIALYARGHPAPRPGRAAPTGRRGLGGLLRHVAVTVAGGYAALLAIVLVFHVLIVGQRGALGSALFGGGFLAFCALVAFPLVSWIEARWRDGRAAGR